MLMAPFVNRPNGDRCYFACKIITISHNLVMLNAALYVYDIF